jgi:hypothetical protein
VNVLEVGLTVEIIRFEAVQLNISIQVTLISQSLTALTDQAVASVHRGLSYEGRQIPGDGYMDIVTVLRTEIDSILMQLLTPQKSCMTCES